MFDPKLKSSPRYILILFVMLSIACSLSTVGCEKIPEGGLDKALLEAARTDKIGKVKRLLNKGANTNEKDEYGRTALMWAADWGAINTVRVLIEHGADVNAKDNMGWTVLMHAISAVRVIVSRSGDNSKYSNVEIAQLLVDKGADVNARNNEGNSVLIVAIEANHHSEFEETYNLVKLLMANGAEVNAVAMDGCTALDLAHPKIIPLLKSAGAIGGEKCKGRIYT